MSEALKGADRGPAHRHVEIGVAIATCLFGGIVMIGALRVGIRWGVEGPGAGFFPFYVGLLIILSSIVNFIRIFSEVRLGKLFAEWGQLRSVVAVVVPTSAYVLLIPYIGIYISSFLLIGMFMRWLGRFGWVLTATVSIAVPLVTYIVFERWFLIPLPKGPVEDWLDL